TFVGKQFSDSQHRIAQLNTDYEKSETSLRETASIPDGHLMVEPEKALTNEDVAKLAEEFVAEEPTKVGEVEIKEVDVVEAKREVASNSDKGVTTAAVTTTKSGTNVTVEKAAE